MEELQKNKELFADQFGLGSNPAQQIEESKSHAQFTSLPNADNQGQNWQDLYEFDHTKLKGQDMSGDPILTPAIS